MCAELPYTTIQASDWQETKKVLGRFEAPWFAFRGQAQSEWALKTSLERAGVTGLPLVLVENFLYREFTGNAHHYLDAAHLPISLLEWLALMQHHGTPTRLLDLTKSPYVAAFFALDEAMDEGGKCAVWAIDMNWFNDHGLSHIKSSIIKFRDINLTLGDFDNPEFFMELIKHSVRFIVQVEPPRASERFRIQQGTFLCIGDLEKGFIGNLEPYDQKEMPKHLFKIELPNQSRTDAIIDLNRMNINSETLFPGMDGFARSLLNRYLIYFGSGSEDIRRRAEKFIANGFSFPEPD